MDVDSNGSERRYETQPSSRRRRYLAGVRVESRKGVKEESERGVGMQEEFGVLYRQPRRTKPGRATHPPFAAQGVRQNYICTLCARC